MNDTDEDNRDYSRGPSSWPLLIGLGLIIAVVMAVLATLWGLDVINVSDDSGTRSARPAATVTVTATVTTTDSALPQTTPETSLSSAGDGGEVAYDAAEHQSSEGHVASSQERAACSVPNAAFISRFFGPDRGQPMEIDRAVMLRQPQGIFVLMVTSLGMGSWYTGADGSVVALDAEGSAISQDPVATVEQHEQIDPGNQHRALLLACISQGFPGDDRQAG